MVTKFRAGISIFLVILMMLMSMQVSVYAGSIKDLNVEKVGGNKITLADIQVKITNNNVEVGKEDVIDVTKDMVLRVDFKIPDDRTDIKAGDFFEVVLPEYLNFSNLNETEIKMKVSDGSEVVLGNVTVSGNKAVMTFTDAIENEDYLGKGGWFSAGLSFDQKKYESSEDKVVVTILGKEFTIEIKPEILDPGHISIQKSGKADIANEEVTWTIKTTPSKEEKKYDGYVLKDTLPANTTFVDDSFEIKPSALNKDNLKIDKDKGIIEYTFDKDVKGVQTIAYKTKIKNLAASNNKDMQIINNVNLTNEETTTSAAATVTVKPLLISKWGKYIVANHSVDWTIRVNSSKATLKNVVVTDVLKDEMTLGSIKIGKNELTEDNTQKRYYKVEGKTVKIYLGDVNQQVSIILNTKLDGTVKAKVENKATLTWDDNGSSISGGNQGISDIGNGEIPTTIKDGFIKKSAGTYDIQKNEMPWNITINNANQKIENATVVELFAYNKDEVSAINNVPKKEILGKYKANVVNFNQKYIEGTLKIVGGETLKIDENVAFTQKGQYKVKVVQLSSSVEAQVVEVYLGNIQEKQEVSLKTKFTYKSAYGVNNKYSTYNVTNRAYLFYGDGKTHLSDSATENHYRHILEKDCEIGYNYVDHTITWRLYVNHKSIDIEAGIITDTLPKYWDVDGENFYEVYHGTDVNLGGSTATIKKGERLTSDEVKALIKNVKITEKDDAKTIQFELNKISDKYVILIKTKLLDQAAIDKQFSNNNNVAIRNYAKMSGSSIVGEQGDYEDVAIKNNLVSKTGSLDKDSKGDYTGDATWTIDINSNAIHLPTDDLSKVYLIDKLQNYLEPKIENGNFKIRIWEVKLNADGSLLKDKEVDQETVQSGIAYKNKELRIKLPKTNGSYRIELVTRITSDTVTQINNIASLEGVKTDIVSKNETIKIEYAEGGAWANLAGKIVLTKTAQKTGATLEGAVFELYEISDNAEQTETLKYKKVTDKDGMIVFGRLKSGKYKLVEVAAPIGYELDKNSSSQIIELDTSSDDTRIINLNIKNEAILRAAQILKTDELGEPLSGAEFTLYKGSVADNRAVAKSKSELNGSVTFKDLKIGVYYIVETKVPTGYMAAATPTVIKAVVDKEGKVSYFTGNNFKDAVTGIPTIQNMAYKGNIVISKVDENGNPLKGAEFKLYDENEKVVGSAVSQGDLGIAKFENVRLGNYTIKETSAPSGYIASNEVISIKESDFSANNIQIAYTVKNVKEPSGGGKKHKDPDPKPTPNNDPKEDPQVNINDEDVPLSDIIVDTNKGEPIKKEELIVIEDGDVPLGMLPSTGGIGNDIFFGLGAGLAAIGAALRRKTSKSK